MVTRKYNETMKRILPDYGIEVIEIARVLVEGEIVSATKVRRSIENKDIDGIKRLVPPSTARMLFKELN